MFQVPGQPQFYPRTVPQLAYGLDPGARAPGPGGSIPFKQWGSMPPSLYSDGRDVEQVSGSRINFQRRAVPLTGSAVLGRLQDNLDPGMLHWEYVEEKTLAQYQRATNTATMHDIPSVMVSWAQMNVYLKSEEGRMKYGSKTDCSDLRRDWHIGGVLQTFTSPDRPYRSELLVTSTYEKRAIMPNIFMVGGKMVHRGSALYAVYLQRDLQDDEDDDFGLKRKGDKEREKKKKQQQQEEEEQKEVPLLRIQGLQPTGEEDEDRLRRSLAATSSGALPWERMAEAKDAEGELQPMTPQEKQVPQSLGLTLGSVTGRYSTTAGTSVLFETAAANTGMDTRGKTGVVPSTYWQIVPVAMPGKGVPSTLTLLSGKTGSIGSWDYIGRVSDVLYFGQSLYEQQTAAKGAIYPEFPDPEPHRKEALKLHTIEVQLCVK